jgi:phage head maturation protease
MFRSTSVVITTTGASELMEVSPVSSPTWSAPCRRRRSAYFWFDKALMGVV